MQWRVNTAVPHKYPDLAACCYSCLCHLALHVYATAAVFRASRTHATPAPSSCQTAALEHQHRTAETREVLLLPSPHCKTVVVKR